MNGITKIKLRCWLLVLCFLEDYWKNGNQHLFSETQKVKKLVQIKLKEE